MRLSVELAEVQAAMRRACSPEQATLLDQEVAWLRSSGAVGAALRLGELVPEFDRADVRGCPVCLCRLLDQGPVIITFVCGSWCRLCATALQAYRQRLAPPATDRATLVAITLERPHGAAALVCGRDWSCHVISDTGSRTARLFGVVYALPRLLVEVYRNLGFDLPQRNDSARWERTLAATYVVDTAGVAAFALVEADHAKRAEPDDILAVLARLRADPLAS